MGLGGGGGTGASPAIHPTEGLTRSHFLRASHKGQSGPFPFSQRHAHGARVRSKMEQKRGHRKAAQPHRQSTHSGMPPNRVGYIKFKGRAVFKKIVSCLMLQTARVDGPRARAFRPRVHADKRRAAQRRTAGRTTPSRHSLGRQSAAGNGGASLSLVLTAHAALTFCGPVPEIRHAFGRHFLAISVAVRRFGSGEAQRKCHAQPREGRRQTQSKRFKG